MADRKPIFEDIDEEIEARAIAEAETEIDAGLGIPHEKVRKWLLKLAKGEIPSTPCSLSESEPVQLRFSPISRLWSFAFQVLSRPIMSSTVADEPATSRTLTR